MLALPGKPRRVARYERTIRARDRRQVPAALDEFSIAVRPAVFAGKQVNGGCDAAGFGRFAAGLQGFFLSFALWLQAGQHFSPLKAGLTAVAFSVGSFIW